MHVRLAQRRLQQRPWGSLPWRSQQWILSQRSLRGVRGARRQLLRPAWPHKRAKHRGDGECHGRNGQGGQHDQLTTRHYPRDENKHGKLLPLMTT